MSASDKIRFMIAQLASTTHLSVSMVLYHSPIELLRATIDSLFQSALRALQENHLVSVDLMLVDNSECDEYAASVRALLQTLHSDSFFSLHFSQAEQNTGFGGGHNSVISRLASNYHLILNPDAELAEDALCAGLAALDSDGQLALVSPRVLGPDGKQEFLCKAYPSVLVLLLRAFAPTFIRRWFRSKLHSYELREVCEDAEPAEVLLASGCFMLLRTGSLQLVKGFNDKYFLYFEDFDLSLRLREYGQLVFLPSMVITHHGGYAATKGGSHIRLFIRSGLRFFNDHGWKWI
ncbi:MAG: GT2 family glycosyltransferase [Halioglobus sp.]